MGTCSSRNKNAPRLCVGCKRNVATPACDCPGGACCPVCCLARYSKSQQERDAVSCHYCCAAPEHRPWLPAGGTAAAQCTPSLQDSLRRRREELDEATHQQSCTWTEEELARYRLGAATDFVNERADLRRCASALRQTNRPCIALVGVRVRPANNNKPEHLAISDRRHAVSVALRVTWHHELVRQPDTLDVRLNATERSWSQPQEKLRNGDGVMVLDLPAGAYDLVVTAENRFGRDSLFVPRLTVPLYCRRRRSQPIMYLCCWNRH